MPKLADIAATPVAEIGRRPAVEVSPESEVGAVVEMMRERRRGSVLVVEGKRLAGIFTERDLMKRIDHSDAAWLRRPVREVMTPEPETIRGERTIEEALGLMLAGGYRRLPLIDGDGAPIGVVSIRDVLAHIAGFFPGDFLNLPPDPQREAREPWGG